MQLTTSLGVLRFTTPPSGMTERAKSRPGIETCSRPPREERSSRCARRPRGCPPPALPRRSAISPPEPLPRGPASSFPTSAKWVLFNWIYFAITPRYASLHGLLRRCCTAAKPSPRPRVASSNTPLPFRPEGFEAEAFGRRTDES